MADREFKLTNRQTEQYGRLFFQKLNDVDDSEDEADEPWSQEFRYGAACVAVVQVILDHLGTWLDEQEES